MEITSLETNKIPNDENPNSSPKETRIVMTFGIKSSIIIFDVLFSNLKL